MRSLIRAVPLLDRWTGQEVQAELYDAINERNVEDFERLWKPEIQAALLKLRATGPLTDDRVASINAQDGHWRWRAKFQERTNPFLWRSFAIEHEGATQGMMFTRLAPFSRLPGRESHSVVYVDLLSVAPWNRPKLAPKPRFGRIGPILLATAISLSVKNGFQGRISLHSLPQSESWYRERCQMTDLGPEDDGPYKGLRYFEMTEAQAKAFLA